MNTFFKRTAVSLVIAGMTSFAYAAVPQNGFFIGVEALDLRPMNGDLDFYSVYKNNSGYNTHSISTDYDWGWRLFGGMRFGDNDDVTLSWLRLRSSSSDHDDSSTYKYVQYISSGYDAVSAKVNFDLDEAYAVLGHTVHFNNPWSIRFAGGLTYARLDSDLKVTETFNRNNISFQPQGDVTAESDSTMKGWGPRAEFDLMYDLGSNFALFANTNISLLVAKRELDISWYENSEFEGDYTFDTRNVVVPKLGLRLGASYTWMMGQAGAEGAGGSSITLAAGWQVDSYIHAVERYKEWQADLPTTKTSNFGDQGLFLGITFNSSWM